MQAESTLENLGYTQHESKIYLAALKLGEGTVTDISRATEMPRTTVQETLSLMQKKGLVSSYVRGAHKIWVAENPERLLAHMKTSAQNFAQILPQLLAMRRGNSSKPSVKIYTGSEIKQILDDIIESKHNISALISMDDWFGFFGEEYTQDFIRRRYSHFLRMRMISPRTETATGLKKQDAAHLRQLKFLPVGIDLKRITNFIYGDKVAIISFNKNEPTGIVIDDSDVAYGNLIYFDNLWKSSLDA